MFSTSCHYGLQAILYIAFHHSDDKNIELKQIAEDQGIPKHFLSKILQQLVRYDLLASMKGPTGGFKLNKPAGEIALIEIVDAIDGLGIFTQCGIGFKQCDDSQPCPIHHDFKGVRNQVRELFESKTLKDLVEDVNLGNSIVGLKKSD